MRHVLTIIIFSIGGYLYGLKAGISYQALFVGAFIGLFGTGLEFLVKKVNSVSIFKGIAGLFLGILFAGLIYEPVSYMFSGLIGIKYVSIILTILFGYLGVVLGAIADIKLSVPVDEADERSACKINVLDTSVIIDGRIADVCEAGFMDGIFILPQFILQELQYIADSSDSLKREKGRRGLDVLHRMQNLETLNVKIINKDFPKIREVDAKLVALAKELGGRIITKDFNLNKVAELQGVLVLNITELASALKPAILPGELMNVFIIKEGKELNQGIAYLEDGTMVVVENGRRFIGKNIEVVMSSVLQTSAGRMAFAKLKESATRDDLKVVKNV
ncbi:MAG TPA: PIN domain-containing protein [Thermodesulfovibrionia bacterium]|nr:PIN domain-containing protein [Thermodesulfovibrionia bacterium]